jgi:hypothetical protein
MDTLQKIWNNPHQQLIAVLKSQGQKSSGDILKDRIRVAQIYSASLNQREAEYLKHPNFAKIMSQSFSVAIKQLDTEVAVADHLDELGLAAIVHQFNHQVMVAVGDNQGVTIWDMASKVAKVVIRLTSHLNPVRCLLQLADGTLAIGCANGKLVIWDYLGAQDSSREERRNIRAFRCGKAWICSLYQLTDGNLVVSTIESNQIWNINVPPPRKFKVLDVMKEGLCLKILSDNPEHIGRSIRQLPNGHIIGGTLNTLSIWDPTIQNVVVLPSETTYVPCSRVTQLRNGNIALNGVLGENTVITTIWNISQSLELQVSRTIPFLPVCQIEKPDGRLFYIGTSSALGVETFEWDHITNIANRMTVVDLKSDHVNKAIILSTEDILSSVEDDFKHYTLKLLDSKTKRVISIIECDEEVTAMVELF